MYIFLPLFCPNWQLQSCHIAATPLRTRESRRSRAVCPPKHNPTRPHCFLTQCPLNPLMSACTAASPPQESLVRNGTRTSLPAKPSPNPNDAGPIVCHPIGLPVAAGCDRAWTQTQNSDTASTAMQCLRPLHHLVLHTFPLTPKSTCYILNAS
jgi:hypothetical protein